MGFFHMAFEYTIALSALLTHGIVTKLPIKKLEHGLAVLALLGAVITSSMMSAEHITNSGMIV